MRKFIIMGVQGCGKGTQAKMLAQDFDLVHISVGDVAGRGVQAAAVMSQLRNALRAYAFEAHPPAIALEHLNRLAWTLDRSVMATLVYLVFDPSSGLIRLANAGHLPPLQAKADGSTVFLEDGRSLPLGARPATAYREAEYILEQGSTLLLYTDGLVETRHTAIDDRLQHLARCLSTGHDGLQDLCDRILETLDPSGEDDVALLALEPVELSPERLHLTMPAERHVLGPLRRALRRWLEHCNAGDEESREIILACNEAFANAIEHAYGPADGLVEIDAELSSGCVFVTIRDFGDWRPPRGENRGRGLPLIEALMDSVDVVRGPRGTGVRVVRKLERRSGGAA